MFQNPAPSWHEVQVGDKLHVADSAYWKEDWTALSLPVIGKDEETVFLSIMRPQLCVFFGNFNRSVSAETKILKENFFFPIITKGQLGVANALLHLHTSGGCCIYAGQQVAK